VKPQEEEQIRCPRCGAADVRKSRRKGLLDRLTGVFSFTAIRCRSCRHRFYRRLWEEVEEEQASTEGRP
jgi:DNA-directed RNA polymerase subunit RPC12/RpoP